MRPVETPRTEQVDVLHGVAVADPYRWLEAPPEDPDLRAWVAAQNAVTRAWLDEGPLRERLRATVAARWDRPRRGLPWRARRDPSRWFQFRNSGLQDQPDLWTMPAADAEGRVLLDATTLSPDGTVAVSGVAASHDGRRLAWAASEAGSDWQTWHVRDVEEGTDLPDEVRWSKFSRASWLPDGSGFLYGRYPEPAPGEDMVAANSGQELWFHRVGTTQGDDVRVLSRADQPQLAFDADVTHDGRWVVVTVTEGTDHRTRLWVAPADPDPAALRFRPLLDDFDAAYWPAGADGDVLYVRTDRDAPRGRVVAVDLADPAPERWREVAAETTATLESADLLGGRLITTWLEDASSRVRRHRLDGTPDGEVPLPGTGSVEAVGGHPDDEAVHLTFTSFADPPAVHRHDLATGTTVRADPSPVLAQPPSVTERHAATSADGTRVPYFLVRRADLPPDPQRPTLLYGYGGYNIPLTPSYGVMFSLWVALGGQLVVANLRGGGEFGEEWHAAGRGAHRRRRVLDDFLAVAEDLLARGWTSRPRLAINGGSNGGMLVGAALTRRPDLFGACVPEVGVFDLLRFHRFTIGWAWKVEYGDPDDPGDFPAIHALSPLHNLRPGTAYPPTLVVTGDHDDRVLPAHSYKFAAALQAAQGGDAPVLLRVETQAGHGAGTPTSAAIAARADVLTFLARTLDLEVD